MPRNSRLPGVTAALCAALAPCPALAHVTVTPDTAVAGGYQVLRVGVGHGCAGQATTELRIELPAGVQAARPQPKPGWREHVEGPADAPTAVVWTGRLPADRFDEFLILLHAPMAPGRILLPAIQRCGATEERWAEPPGADGQRPQRPAPVVTLTAPGTPSSTPAAPSAEDTHEHHH